jgi:hypothetical protein
MYDEIYQEYIRSVLGYPERQPLYQNEMYNLNYDNRNNYQNFLDTNIESDMNNRDANKYLEDFYPDIYTLIYPIIQEKCQENRGELTKETINKMTEEVYLKVQGEKKIKEDRGDRQNSNLQDLIKILILRELLQRPRPPFRPPAPPRSPMIPPFGPPPPPPRPPVRPR